MYYRSSYKFQSVLKFLRFSRTLFCRNHITGNLGRNSPDVSVGRYGYSLKHQRLQLFSSNSRETWTGFGSNMIKDGKEKVELSADAPASPRRYFPYWARWVLGSILTVLPFSHEKWAQLHTIEGKADMVVEEVENVAEAVERVAIVAEKVSSEVADKLPHNGKLKDTALFVERVSQKAAQDAQLTKDFVHKVDGFMHDLEDLETVVEPRVNLKHEAEGKVFRSAKS